MSEELPKYPGHYSASVGSGSCPELPSSMTTGSYKAFLNKRGRKEPKNLPDSSSWGQTCHLWIRAVWFRGFSRVGSLEGLDPEWTRWLEGSKGADWVGCGGAG